MKLSLTFILSLLVFTLPVIAQQAPYPASISDQNHDQCGHKTSQDKLYHQHPQTRPENNPAHKALETFTQEFSHSSQRNMAVITIPVVVHVVHDNGPENLTDAEIIDGIALINEDFSATNEEIPSEIHNSFLNLVADCEMNFELARFDPNGVPTNGITRQVSSYTYGGDDPNMKLQYNWPREKYLNIWLVNKPFAANSSSGFAYYPPSVDDPTFAHYDGVVIAYWAYGRHDETSIGYEHVMSHEIGHWANLKHTWGDQSDFGTAAACNDDDLVNDTPNTEGHAFYGDCTLETFSCGTLDNNNNFMDYTGTCTAMFTLGQKDRMLASMNSSISGRNNLWSATNISETLGDPNAPLLVYNTLTISEDITNDGTVNGSMDVTLSNANFSQNTGAFSAGVHYNITGLPTGLSATVNVNSNTSLTISVNGTAPNHADADDATYTIAFQDAAFSAVTAAQVSGAENAALMLDFLDPYTVIYVDLDDPYAEKNGQAFEFFALNYGNAEFGTWLYDGDFFKLETYGNGAICNTGTRNITPLGCGVTIGSSDIFTEPDPYPGQLDISNPSYTDWNGKTAYIGIRFRKGGYNHYGWLKATVLPDGNKFTVTEAAYHTGPEYPITTGNGCDALLNYTPPSVAESITNDGSFNSYTNIIAENVTFSQNSGSFTENTHFTVSGLPTGLTASVEVISHTLVELHIDGSTTPHDDIDDTNINVSFWDAAFSGTLAANVTNGTNAPVLIDFTAPYEVICVDLADPFAQKGVQDWEYFTLNYGNTEYGTWLYDNDNFKLETYGKGVMCYPNTRNIQPLGGGVEVSANSTFTVPGDYPNQLDVSNLTYTDWNGYTGYMGFEFVKDGYIHYGWFLAEVTAAGDKFTILEAAYNTAPNGAVITGSCGGASPLTISFDSTPVTCSGGSDGRVTAVPIGGQSPFTYSWNTNESSATISNLSVGTYTVTVTDNNNTTGTATITIGEAPQMILNISPTNESSAGASDGVADLSITNGIEPYTYNWSNGATTQDISGLSAGTYDVVVSDGNACTAVASITIYEGSNATYCPANTLLDHNFISRVHVAGIDNASTWNGYSDFSNVIGVMEAGSSYDLTITCDIEYWEDISLGTWIDWNGDGDFDDVDEEVYLFRGEGPYTTTIVAPIDLTEGSTRMRVRLGYGSDMVACGEDTYQGEVEDYSLNLMGGTSSGGDYCIAYTELDYNHISNINVAGINNNSVWDSGYGNYTNLLGQMDAGENYSLNMNCESEHWDDIAVGAWIDWNMDGDFEDANEEVYRIRGTGPFGSNINVPMDIPNGVTRFRVRLGYGADMEACGYDNYQGEVEDYSMQLRGVSLAAELLDFKAKKSNHHIVLNWETTNEINQGYFVIEKSKDGRTFEKINQIPAKNKATNVYKLIDTKAFKGLNYYRLKQVDIAGQVSFSKVVVVDFNDKNTIQIYPNPVEAETLNLSFTEVLEKTTKVEVLDYMGRVVVVKELMDIRDTQLNISGLTKGVYVLKMEDVAVRFVRL